MNRVILHGSLGEEFGSEFLLDLDTPRCAIRALATQMPGFYERLSQGHWQVVRGAMEDGQRLDAESLSLGMADADLHIVPTLHGAGNDVGKVIVGAAMIGAAFMVPGFSAATTAMLAGAGAGILVAGVTMMLTPLPDTGDYESKEADSQSFLFNGPVNVNKQGVPVPLVYGEVITGSVVISAGIRAEDIEIGVDYSLQEGKLLP